jgi:hypothetical protein
VEKLAISHSREIVAGPEQNYKMATFLVARVFFVTPKADFPHGNFSGAVITQGGSYLG